jgi:hypothetical protein
MQQHVFFFLVNCKFNQISRNVFKWQYFKESTTVFFIKKVFFIPQVIDIFYFDAV